MKYDNIHNRYVIAFGLYFKLTDKHVNSPGDWRVVDGTIPGLNSYICEARTKEGAALEVLSKIKKMINLEDEDGLQETILYNRGESDGWGGKHQEL